MCKSVWDEETWAYIILNYDRLIFKEFNNGTKLTTSDMCIFLLSYLLLRSPFRVFNLTDFCFFFSNTPQTIQFRNSETNQMREQNSLGKSFYLRIIGILRLFGIFRNLRKARKVASIMHASVSLKKINVYFY